MSHYDIKLIASYIHKAFNAPW